MAIAGAISSEFQVSRISAASPSGLRPPVLATTLIPRVLIAARCGPLCRSMKSGGNPDLGGHWFHIGEQAHCPLALAIRAPSFC